MPTITTAATFITNTADGWEELAYRGFDRVLLFAGVGTGTLTVVEYLDDTGAAQILEGGTISSLPTTLTVTAPVTLRVRTTGSPNFNVTVLRRHNNVQVRNN